MITHYKKKATKPMQTHVYTHAHTWASQLWIIGRWMNDFRAMKNVKNTSKIKQIWYCYFLTVKTNLSVTHTLTHATWKKRERVKYSIIRNQTPINNILLSSFLKFNNLINFIFSKMDLHLIRLNCFFSLLIFLTFLSLI